MPSLPLINSLSHLSYLTSVSPRIRDILTTDGGLERLVRILKVATACPSKPKLSSGDIVVDDDDDFDDDGVDKSAETCVPPFRPFAELRPQSRSMAAANAAAASSTATKHLLYTYTLAYQCIVNVGVRGSEAIRTRVAETGVLDVVVHILTSYLNDIKRDLDDVAQTSS